MSKEHMFICVCVHLGVELLDEPVNSESHLVIRTNLEKMQ